MPFYIYILIGFAAGFIVAFILQLITILKLRKENKSAKGLLESEKLIKENANKENNFLLQSADASLLTTRAKLKQAQDLIRLMDNDILLLQKSNEDTEALLAKGEPAIHEIKLKLIEANNVIARYKSITGEK